jgi:DNA-directed RNA polymerase subunit L
MDGINPQSEQINFPFLNLLRVKIFGEGHTLVVSLAEIITKKEE